MAKRNRAFYITIAILALILSASIGYQIGYQAGQFSSLNWAVEKAKMLLEINGYKVNIATPAITAGLIQYRGDVDRLLNITAKWN